MESSWFAVDKVSSCFGEYPAAVCGEGDGDALGTVYPFALASLAHDSQSYGFVAVCIINGVVVLNVLTVYIQIADFLLVLEEEVFHMVCQRDGFRVLESIEFEVVPEAYHVDAFPFLGDAIISGVQYLVCECIPQFLHGGFDDIEGVPVVMRGEVLHVLHEYDFRLFAVHDSCHVEEQCPSAVVESLLVAADGECLAGEPCTEDIMAWYGVLVDFGDVAFGGVVEVLGVYFLCVWVPFVRVEALCP